MITRAGESSSYQMRTKISPESLILVLRKAQNEGKLEFGNTSSIYKDLFAWWYEDMKGFGYQFYICRL